MCQNKCGTELEVEDTVFVVFCDKCFKDVNPTTDVITYDDIKEIAHEIYDGVEGLYRFTTCEPVCSISTTCITEKQKAISHILEYLFGFKKEEKNL